MSFLPAWVFKCFCKEHIKANDFVHWLQLWAFSPLCTVKCLRKSLDWANDLSHRVQLKGFSPVWTLRCAFIAPDRANDLLQYEQLYGFSPVWTLKCFLNSPDKENVFVHREQLKGFSPVWILICLCRLCIFPKDLLQREHLRGSPTCSFQCFLRSYEQKNDLAQNSHLWDFSGSLKYKFTFTSIPGLTYIYYSKNNKAFHCNKTSDNKELLLCVFLFKEEFFLTLIFNFIFT